MSDFATVLALLKGYAHKPNEDTFLSEAIIRALVELRALRFEFAETTYQFYTENGRFEYRPGYPNFPSGVRSWDSIEISTSPVTQLGIPNEIVSSANITGDETDIDDRPISPDFNSIVSTVAATPTNALIGFTSPESDPPLSSVEPFNVLTQKFIVLLASLDATARTVTLELKELAGALATKVVTVLGDGTRQTFEFDWDAHNLVDPTGGDVRLHITDPGVAGAGLAIHAAEWHSNALPPVGSEPAHPVSIVNMRELRGFAFNTVLAKPDIAAFHGEAMILYPTPAGEYLITGDMLVDSTKDEVTGLPVASGTDTNIFFQERGRSLLINKALQMYHMERTQDQEKATIAKIQYEDVKDSLEREQALKIFNGPVEGYI